MRIKSIILLMCVMFIAGAGEVCLAESGHYVNGVEGIKAASVPPPGYYLKIYNVYYTADKMTDGDGEEAPIDFDVTVYAFVPRFIWVSKMSFLGGTYGADIVVPIVSTDLKIGALSLEDDQFGLGDINIEPLLLSWHGPKWDGAFGVSFYLPTGSYDATEPASPGKGFWTGMLTAGYTQYFDANKLWSFSVLPRFEFHGEKDGADITPGSEFHFEWGVGRTMPRTWIWDVGVAGYCHWQVTDDSGNDVDPDTKSTHDRVFAVGPEVDVVIPQSKLIFNARGLVEFNAVDRSEGMTLGFTIIKIL